MHLIRHSQRETVAASSPPSSRNRFGALDDEVDFAHNPVGGVEGTVVANRAPTSVEACDRWAFPPDTAPTRRIKRLRIHMRESQASTVTAPPKSLLDDMEQQLLSSPLEEFDLLLKILVAIQISGQHLQARTNSPMMTQRAWSDRCRVTVKTQSASGGRCSSTPSSTVESSFRRDGPHGPFRNTLKVAMEEASSSEEHTRQVLEGPELAPGNHATLDALQDEERRPPLPRGALPRPCAPHARQTISIGRTYLQSESSIVQEGAAAGPSDTCALCWTM